MYTLDKGGATMKKTLSITFTIILVLLSLSTLFACNSQEKNDDAQINRYTISEKDFNNLIINGNVIGTNANVSYKITAIIPERSFRNQMKIKISDNIYRQETDNDVSYKEVQQDTYNETNKTYMVNCFYYNNGSWKKEVVPYTFNEILRENSIFFVHYNYLDFTFDKENHVYTSNRIIFSDGYKKYDAEYYSITIKNLAISFLDGTVEKIQYTADIGNQAQNAEITLEFYDYGTTVVTLPTIE